MLQTYDVGVVSRRRWRRTPDVGCCMKHGVATWSQHGRRREEARRYLYVARNLLATLLVMARNMLATFAP
jgi:hypothetical protein